MIFLSELCVHLPLCPLWLFLFSISIFANPIRFQRDQINYIYHDTKINETTLEKFHGLFENYYSKTLDDLLAKKNYPLRVEIYTDANRFRADTGLASFTAGMFDAKTETFYFLLTPKTLQEDKLITIISHEACHAAIHSKKLDFYQIPRSLEEGFCYLHYPSETILNRDVSAYSKMGFNEFLSISEKNLASSDKKKREEIYQVSARFIRFISKEKNKEDLVKILLDKQSLRNLDKEWERFTSPRLPARPSPEGEGLTSRKFFSE